MRKNERYVSAQLQRLLASYLASYPEAARTVRLSSGAADGTADPYTRIDAAEICAAFAALAEKQNRPLNGLQLAQRLGTYRGNHLLLSIMSYCGTLEKAIEKLIQYHDIASNTIRLRLRRASGGAMLVLDADLPAPPPVPRVLTEAAVAACAAMLCDLTSGWARAQSVRFRFPAPPVSDEYNRFFGCPVRFGQAETALVLSSETLRLPIVMSDKKLLAVLEDYAADLLRQADAGDGLKRRVLRDIKERLIRGKDLKIQGAASRLSLSVRVLQKKLKAEGTSYRALMETAKRDVALQCLRKGDLPLTDIAFLLGFSEQSAFNHAFKRWTGVSPRQYIRQP